MQIGELLLECFWNTDVPGGDCGLNLSGRYHLVLTIWPSMYYSTNAKNPEMSNLEEEKIQVE